MKPRHKIKASTLDRYREIRKLLEDNNVPIYVASEKRLMLSTDELSQELISQVESKEGIVRVDPLFSLQ